MRHKQSETSDRARPRRAPCVGVWLLLAVASLTSAQVLDSVIRLHNEVWDMLPVPGGKLCIEGLVRTPAYCNVVSVADCSTYAVLRTIPLGRAPQGHSWTYNWRRNKLYCAGATDSGGLAVIDCSTDSLIAWCGVRPFENLAYNSLQDRIYACGDSMWIVDCSADTPLPSIAGLGRTWVLWDSVGNKLYNGGGQSVFVVDCSADTLLTRVYTGIGFLYYAAYSAPARKAYLASDDVFGAVVFCSRGDSVLANDLALAATESPIVCNEAEGKAYWVGQPETPSDTIFVISMADDSIVRRLTVPWPWTTTVRTCALAPWSNRLYVAWLGRDSAGVYHSYLDVLDCHTDSFVGRVLVSEHTAYNVLCNRYDHKVYASVRDDSAVYVFRDTLLGVAEPAPVCGRSASDCRISPNPAGEWLTYEGDAPAALYSADGRRVLALRPGRNDIRALPAGVYLARPTGGNGAATRKLVIER